nr:hypothetical protein [Tanacetum cinerariifolium]
MLATCIAKEPVEFKAPKTTHQTDVLGHEGTKPEAKTKRGNSKGGSNPPFSSVDSTSHQEAVFLASTIIHSKSTSGRNALIDSTAKADPGKSDPKDLLFQQQCNDEGTKNFSIDHVIACTNLSVLVDKTQYAGDGLGTPPPSPKSIKIQELISQVLLLQTQNIKLEKEKDVVEAEIALSSAQPLFLNVQQLTKLLVDARENTKLDLPAGLLALLEQTTPQTKGEQVKDKGKKAMSREEVTKEESKSNSYNEIKLTGSLVKTAKQKPLKNFTYINEKGETFQMTHEEIKNQKGIKHAVKADAAKSKIKKGKKYLINMLGHSVVDKVYKDKAGTVLNEPTLGMILFNSKQRQDFISIKDFKELNNDMLYHVQEILFVLHHGPGWNNLARTFSSFLVAEDYKRNLNLNKQMTLIK